jgi:hypothetical protein
MFVLCCIRAVEWNTSDMKDERILKKYKMDQREKTGQGKKKSRGGNGCFVLCFLYKDGSMERHVT